MKKSTADWMPTWCFRKNKISDVTIQHLQA